MISAKRKAFVSNVTLILRSARVSVPARAFSTPQLHRV